MPLPPTENISLIKGINMAEGRKKGPLCFSVNEEELTLTLAIKKYQLILMKAHNLV